MLSAFGLRLQHLFEQAVCKRQCFRVRVRACGREVAAASCSAQRARPGGGGRATVSTKGGPAPPTAVRATLAPCTAAVASTAPSTAAPVASPSGLCDCSDNSTTRAGATSGKVPEYCSGIDVCAPTRVCACDESQGRQRTAQDDDSTSEARSCFTVCSRRPAEGANAGFSFGAGRPRKAAIAAFTRGAK